MLIKIERSKIEAKTRATNKDVVGERKWKEKANESKKELSEIEAKVKEVEGKINGIEESKSLETFKLRSEWEAKVKEAKKDLRSLSCLHLSFFVTFLVLKNRVAHALVAFEKVKDLSFCKKYNNGHKHDLRSFENEEVLVFRRGFN